MFYCFTRFGKEDDEESAVTLKLDDLKSFKLRASHNQSSLPNEDDKELIIKVLIYLLMIATNPEDAED